MLYLPKETYRHDAKHKAIMYWDPAPSFKADKPWDGLKAGKRQARMP